MNYKLERAFYKFVTPTLLSSALSEHNLGMSQILTWEINTENPFIIPAIIFNNTISSFRQSNLVSPSQTLYCPLFTRTQPGSYSYITTSGSHNGMFALMNQCAILIWHKMRSSSEKYLAQSGVIMDENKNVLVLSGYKCEIQGEDRFVTHNPVIIINPQVFININSPFCKWIIKYLIPFYLSHNVTCFNGDGSTHSEVSEVLVKDISSSFKTPTPNSTVHINEDVQNFLVSLEETTISKSIENGFATNLWRMD